MGLNADFRLITKADFLTASQCAAMGWHARREQTKPPNEASLFRMQQGQEIGELARELYSNGVLVGSVREKSCATVTRELMTDSSNNTLFEAQFEADQFVAKADILIREGEGWHLLEVKSSFSDSKSIPDYVDDLAYSTMVIRRAGVRIVSASLVLLSREYRYKMSADRLFVRLDKTAEADGRVAVFEGDADRLAAIVLGQSQPAAVLISGCRSCDYFKELCLGSGYRHTILELPNLHASKLEKLSGNGIIDLAKLPEDIVLTERQQRVKDATLSGTPFITGTLRGALDLIQWPCHYLDFETVATVLPLYNDHGCHQQVLTQFSVHHKNTLDGQLTQTEFLADAERDEERELAVALLKALGSEGSIVVYSSFEKTRIAGLRDKFPDLADDLGLVLERLFDLYPVVVGNVYYPGFSGSFSIKAVMPALVPDLSYAGLAVADGDTAITKFARMARGEVIGDTALAARKELLDYCRLDTLSMVRLHEVLIKVALLKSLQ